MANTWKRDYLDALLVPSGLVLLLAYHARLAFRVRRAPASTAIGLHHLALQAWVHSTLKEGLKNGVFVVQTMRNSIMTSTILAGAAMTMSSMVGVVLTNDRKILASGQPNTLMLGQTGLVIGPSIKLLTLLACFMVSALCYVRSATFYSNASFLLSMPSHTSTTLPSIAVEHFKKSVVSAFLLRVIGTRAFFFSLPLFVWLYGPWPMFCTSLLSIALLFIQDSVPCPKARVPEDAMFEASPLIDFGPLPPDSPCLFCPHH